MVLGSYSFYLSMSLRLIWLWLSMSQLQKIESRRRRGRQKMRWFDVITDSTDKFRELVMGREAQVLQSTGWTTDQQN